VASILGPDFLADFRMLRKADLPWWAALGLGLGMFVTILLFHEFGIGNLSLPFLFSLLALNLVITIKWQLRTYTWFKITMVTFAILHAPLILYHPFQGFDDKANMRAYAGLSGIDMIVMLAILSFVHKCTGQRGVAQDESPKHSGE
jgi:hypothetical protein